MIGARYRPAQRKKEARVRRHSVNSGLVPLGWGLLVLVGLSLYEFFPPLAASVGVCVLAAFGGMVTAWYARRLCFAGVQPSRAAIREYMLLIDWLDGRSGGADHGAP